jgi:hypothetical protein
MRDGGRARVIAATDRALDETEVLEFHVIARVRRCAAVVDDELERGRPGFPAIALPSASYTTKLPVARTVIVSVPSPLSTTLRSFDTVRSTSLID